MTVPVRPEGCLETTNFGMLLTSTRMYHYGIVDCCESPTAWDTYPMSRPRRLSLSRSLTVVGTRTYRDELLWFTQMDGSVAIADSQYTAAAAGYRAWKNANANARPDFGMPIGPQGREAAVVEIVAWDDDSNPPDDDCILHTMAVDEIPDEEFDYPGSQTRQHVERRSDTCTSAHYASAYHASWCLATSLNRSEYEDRQSYCWPVFSFPRD
jgi:hypothetical protein